MNNLFRTSDFPQICTLVSLGFTIKEIDRSDTRRFTFAFEDSEDLQKKVKEYWDGSLSINPKDLWNAKEEVKTRMYNL